MINIREIQSSQEQKIAFEIRKKVFVEEQFVPLDEEYDEFETKSTHFLAFYNDIPVGTARIRATPYGIKLERLAILKEYRGIGLGTSLVKKLLTHCKNETNSSVYLYAQTSAQKFYEKFYFEVQGEIFFEVGLEHIEMLYVEKRDAI